MQKGPLVAKEFRTFRVMMEKPTYQLLALGSPYYLDELVNALKDMPYISFVDIRSIDEKLPLLILYYGQTVEDKTKDYLLDLSRRAKAQEVLPIVREANKFSDYIPATLDSINAFILSDEKTVHKLRNRILSWFGLLDNTRKIFISYKRSDTTALAQQLFDTLVKKGYIPFLDSYSLEAGVDFQEYLMNEISDSDMFIMLNSSNYDQSEYTKAELVAASRLGIGILQVVFPTSKNFEEARISSVMQLKNQLPPDSKYKQEVVENIIYNMERYRALGFRTKRRIIIDGLKSKCDGKTISTLEDGSVSVESSNIVYYPVTHVPTSEDLEIAYKSMSKLNLEGDIVKKICYYGIHCRRDKRDHMNWLNMFNLPVLSEDISD